MKKLPFSLLLLFITCFATAQITTTNWLYQFDEFENTYRNNQGQRRNTTIKLLNTAHFENTNNLFGTHILNQIKTDKLTIYKDIACTQPYRKSDLETVYERLSKTVIDTVITFDPETFEEEVKIVKWNNIIYPSKEIGYRVKQDWNFNETTQKLSSFIHSLSIANVDLLGVAPYFSVKVKDGDKAVTAADLKNDDFILVQRIECRANFVGKGMEKYLLTDEHFEKNKVYFINDEMSLDEINQSFEESIDTIITFDPETFAEEIRIIKQDAIDKSEIGNYRIIQDFYLDPVNMIVKSKVIAIAPLRAMKNKFGIHLKDVPMFWIVYDDAFFKGDK